MTPKIILNDVHIGVARTGGATPQTGMQLRSDLLDKFQAVVMDPQFLNHDLIINGDLFDAYDIPPGDALRTYQILSARAGVSPDTEIVLGRGNHDISKDSSRLSMFDFIGNLLVSRYKNIRLVTTPQMICDPSDNMYMIPHCLNQEVFNIELDRALELESSCIIFLHANYDNHFAVESDHSLNVSEEQADKLRDVGHTLVFGHEHQAREFEGLIITGNQFPTSVADCLNNPKDHKWAMVLTEEVTKHGHSTERWISSKHETWKVEGSFTAVDWKEIDENTTGEFIRVGGKATAEEAALALQAVSKLRQRSTAYVVTNGVKVEGVECAEEIDVAIEEMKVFDVLDFLHQNLDPEQSRVVKELLQKETAA